MTRFESLQMMMSSSHSRDPNKQATLTAQASELKGEEAATTSATPSDKDREEDRSNAATAALPTRGWNAPSHIQIALLMINFCR